MALTETQRKTILWLKNRPVEFAHVLGFNKLTDLHNEWIRDMVYGVDDETLQAHRGSYKTTCVSVALSAIVLVYPNDKTMFMRKTDSDIQEVIAQVKKILAADATRHICKNIWGCDLTMVAERHDQLTTNLASNDPRGTAQLSAMGTKGSLTGKHFDRIFTDDIVNVNDRVSKAERDRTKVVYQELQNIKNRGGRIYNTGTPWHKDDAFSIMPNPKKFDCYETGLITADALADIKSKMEGSLFAANYELRHVATDDILFDSPQTGYDPALVEQGICHIDAAYGGSDFTAFTICRKLDGKYYVFGKLWKKHIDDVEDEAIGYRRAFNAGRISVEDNGDKGYLGRDLRAKGERTHVYHENMNKYLKITTYLKSVWRDVYFVAGTDEEYINQVCDYNEDAEHDDAPDSLASIIRELWGKKEKDIDTSRLILL